MANYTDEQLAQLEKQLEAELNAAPQSSGDYGTPTSPDKDTPYKFFREIINSKDSKKTGNVSSPELGKPKMPIRSALKIALYANAEGLNHVSDYLKNIAEIDLATSSSKDGFLSKLFVTQIRKTQSLNDKPAEKKGWSMFGSKKDEPVVVD